MINLLRALGIRECVHTRKKCDTCPFFCRKMIKSDDSFKEFVAYYKTTNFILDFYIYYKVIGFLEIIITKYGDLLEFRCELGLFPVFGRIAHVITFKMTLLGVFAFGQ